MPSGGEMVEVGPLVVTLLEALDPDPALVSQGPEAVVDLAQADAEFIGQLSLVDMGVVVQLF